MKTLNLPGRNTAADLQKCIENEKNPAAKARLLAAKPAVIKLFKSYNKGAWDFEKADTLHHLSAEVKRDLLRTYALTGRRRALKDLRADILRVPDDLCPYCRLEKPDTLDHFLPKSRHQPFASFAPNLLPMCNTCNTKKGIKGSKTARQFFTHAYFDALADGDAFLMAQVAVGKRYIATNFAIDFSASLDAGVFNRLVYQFSVLRLGERYQLQAVDVIYEQALKLQGMDQSGASAEAKRRSLEGDAEEERRLFGVSYWKTALLNALARSSAFYEGGYNRAL